MIRRGEVYWVNFDQSAGGEVRKKRPAVVISNDRSNHYANRVQVAPCSSKIETIYPCEVEVRFNGKISKVMADQISTVSKKKIGEYVATLAAEDMKAVEQVIKFQLNL